MKMGKSSGSVTKIITGNILKSKGWRLMFKKRRCCCRRTNAPGFFLIALGIGLFMAYAIPRYLLITMLGVALIGVGVCLVIKK